MVSLVVFFGSLNVMGSNGRVLVDWYDIILVILIFEGLNEATQDGGPPIDCEELVVYYKVLAKHFEGKCGNKCPENVQNAIKWFRRAQAQLASECYFDEYADWFRWINVGNA